ncbi:type II toxin-antitoxin system VapC family toxin [Phyllobacterium zundukense]|uniref:PIN domain-containing protein n=1 Tax=Phyllobacterium zundukense TaxID=1867719 RepID=A0A2N9VYL4_9HYPH|nr:type II toxin-antitoxin system VapC family toxin [Phyllobacterium zundukense]ATU95171.1 PIN domain-containing protein [Phyllobacterium zundukense]PIO44582.1 PIN domain-containing protein [Phyllobacterium zundukense]
MFVDACAIVSMMAGEATAAAHEAALLEAITPVTSTLAAWEAIIVLSRPDQLNCRYSEAEGAVVEWLEDRNIKLRDPAVPRRVLSYAVAVAEQHGIGKRYLSNFDCFHYAYAKAMRQPLLTLDQLLRNTDVETKP